MFSRPAALAIVFGLLLTGGCDEDAQLPELGPGSGRPGFDFLQVAAGSRHSCGVTDGDLAVCWGRGEGGRLGTGTEQDRPTPTAVAGGLALSQVSAGAEHTCALAISGALFCWGRGAAGRLGTGTEQ
ncbi:MAG: hypothetical protein ACE5HP_05415, partial [Gemmatimonadota bacterium]